MSSFGSTIAYIAISALIALCFGSLNSDNVLTIMQSSDLSSEKKLAVVTRVCAYLFSLFIIMPGTPVYQISIRYNLYVGKICSKKLSFFWSVIAPWLVGFIFVQGQFFAAFLDWTALIFGSIVNFIVPFVLYYMCLRARRLQEQEDKDLNDVNTLLNEFDSIEEKDDTHQALPSQLKQYANIITIGLIGLMVILVVSQIIVLIYYQVHSNQDLAG